MGLLAPLPKESIISYGNGRPAWKALAAPGRGTPDFMGFVGSPSSCQAEQAPGPLPALALHGR